jgi:hypothetical protein
VNNGAVRKLVGIALVIAVTLLTGADRISCPDGCTSQEQTSATEHSQAPVHECVLCALGVETQAIVRCDAPPVTVSTVVFSVQSALLSAPISGIEHPPRVA